MEFASADAVRGATDVQRSMAEQNAAVPQDQRIEFRMGIHVGDITLDDNDIFGDGVNIAVRLESLAEPGGVAFRMTPIGRSGARSTSHVTTSDHRTSRILPMRCGFGAFN